MEKTLYKLMMVDDEDEVRKRVINSIDWEEYGFEIVAEAENGKEALEKFLLTEPDVVITDIKMPFMDGLELSENILKDYPYTKIIVLTGFDEFEYAKKSIDLNVMKYVLKPISLNEIIKIIVETREKINKEIETRNSLERLKLYYDESYPIMRQRFLEGLINGDFLMDSIKKWINYYKIDLFSDEVVITVVKIDGLYKEMLNSQTGGIDRKKIALWDITKEICDQFNLGTHFFVDDYVVILSSNNEDRENYITYLIRSLDKLRQAVQKYLDFTVTIGVGYVVNCLTELKESYEGALNAVDYKHTLGKNKIIYIEDIEQNRIPKLKLLNFEKSDYRRILKTGTESESGDYIDLMFRRISSTKQTEENTVFLLEVIMILIQTTQEMNIKLAEIEKGVSIQEVMTNIKDIDYVKNALVLLSEQVIKQAKQKRINTSKELVIDVQEYVNQNYNDWTITVDSISAKFNYSANYFSTLFKKETGISFMKYLLDKRLNVAKDLLLTSDKKNFEIAMEVGFNSGNYFSYCFKKELGVSPSQFKKESVK